MREVLVITIKQISWILVIGGMISSLIGIWLNYGYWYDSTPFEYHSILYIIFGIMFLMTGLQNIMPFGVQNYRREWILFLSLAVIFIPFLLIPYLLGYLGIIDFAYIYVATITSLIWVFIIRWAELNQNRVPGRLFEFLFFVLLFFSTYFFTAAIGKASITLWRIDLEIFEFIVLGIALSVSALHSGFIHYVKGIHNS